MYSPLSPTSSSTAGVSAATNVTMTIASTGYHTVEVFCTQDHCIFGWMSQTWIVFMLMFGLWIGVVCITGFNYAVRFSSYYHRLFFDSLNILLLLIDATYFTISLLLPRTC